MSTPNCSHLVKGIPVTECLNRAPLGSAGRAWAAGTAQPAVGVGGQGEGRGEEKLPGGQVYPFFSFVLLPME